MSDAARQAASRVAVLGLATTTGTPPLIFETAIYHLSGAQITAGPLCYWIAPACSLYQVPVPAWPNVRLAPSWQEVAERITDVIADRVLAVLDADRWEVLSRHVPDWRPARTIYARELDAAGEIVAGLPPRRSAVEEAMTVATAVGVSMTRPPSGHARGRPGQAGPIRGGRSP